MRQAPDGRATSRGNSGLSAAGADDADRAGEGDRLAEGHAHRRIDRHAGGAGGGSGAGDKRSSVAARKR